MHPILARPGRLNPYLAACMPLAAILTALLGRPGAGIRVYEAVAMAVPLTCAYAFMGLSVWYVCRQFRFQVAPRFGGQRFDQRSHLVAHRLLLGL